MHQIGLFFRPKDRYHFARTLAHYVLRENPDLGLSFPAEREPLVHDELRQLFLESVSADYPDMDEESDPLMLLAPNPKRPRMTCSRQICECYHVSPATTPETTLQLQYANITPTPWINLIETKEVNHPCCCPARAETREQCNLSDKLHKRALADLSIGFNCLDSLTMQRIDAIWAANVACRTVCGSFQSHPPTLRRYLHMMMAQGQHRACFYVQDVQMDLTFLPNTSSMRDVLGDLSASHVTGSATSSLTVYVSKMYGSKSILKKVWTY